MSERRPGRPRTEAPAGYVTVSEAAALLGVSDAAIRRRMDRGTLPFETEPQETASGKQEVRIYIPREAIEKAMSEKMLPATKEDTSEVRVQMSEATELVLRRFSEGLAGLREGQGEVKQAIESQRADVLAKLGEMDRRMTQAIEIMLDAAQHEKEYQRRVLELMERVEDKRRPWWRRLLGI